MRFMVLVHPGDRQAYEVGQMPEPAAIDEMMKFNEELVDAGVMLNCDGLHPTSKAVRVHFPDKGRPRVTNGPFTESRELIGGFWLWQVKSKEEALEWAKRAPMEDGATLEIRQLFESSDFGPEVEERERRLRERIR